VIPDRVSVPDAATRGAGLSQSLRDTAAAVAATLFTTDAGPPPPERIAWLCDDLHDFFVRAGDRARGTFRVCLTVISLAAPWFVGKLGTFRGLDETLRARALERMERSPLALAVFGAKAVLCFVYYEHPDAARLVGHSPRCLVNDEARP
jgi:hypothetical protein